VGAALNSRHGVERGQDGRSRRVMRDGLDSNCKPMHNGDDPPYECRRSGDLAVPPWFGRAVLLDRELRRFLVDDEFIVRSFRHRPSRGNHRPLIGRWPTRWTGASVSLVGLRIRVRSPAGVCTRYGFGRYWLPSVRTIHDRPRIVLC